MNVELRVKKYLEKDKNGIRKELLLIFLDGKKHTSDEIFEILKSKGYDVNRKSVSAMLGVVSSKLGIVKTELGEKKKYYIKSEYVDLVERAVKASI
uniref:DUF2551 domain-containing protein n=1 Tax=Archaeoglobus fulgidus TaxID=2234 RepID=A0A7J2THS4_ARCFL